VVGHDLSERPDGGLVTAPAEGHGPAVVDDREGEVGLQACLLTDAATNDPSGAACVIVVDLETGVPDAVEAIRAGSLLDRHVVVSDLRIVGRSHRQRPIAVLDEAPVGRVREHRARRDAEILDEAFDELG